MVFTPFAKYSIFTPWFTILTKVIVILEISIFKNPLNHIFEEKVIYNKISYFHLATPKVLVFHSSSHCFDQKIWWYMKCSSSRSPLYTNIGEKVICCEILYFHPLQPQKGGFYPLGYFLYIKVVNTWKKHTKIPPDISLFT